MKFLCRCLRRQHQRNAGGCRIQLQESHEDSLCPLARTISTTSMQYTSCIILQIPNMADCRGYADSVFLRLDYLLYYNFMRTQQYKSFVTQNEKWKVSFLMTFRRHQKITSTQIIYAIYPRKFFGKRVFVYLFFFKIQHLYCIPVA